MTHKQIREQAYNAGYAAGAREAIDKHKKETEAASRADMRELLRAETQLLSNLGQTIDSINRTIVCAITGSNPY